MDTNAATETMMIPATRKRKLWKKKDPNRATTSSIVSFCGSTFFSRSIGELIASYFTLFLTDFMLLRPEMIVVLMLVTRIIDAFTDPIAGAIVDITHSPWGKSRPYVLFGSFPLAIFTVLLFTVPNFSLMGRLVYVYVIYIGYGLAQTIFSVPLATLGMSITADPTERKNIYTISGFMGSFGTAIPGAVPIIFQYVATSHSAQETAYFLIGMVIGAGTLIFGISAFFTMKEKTVSLSQVKKEKVKLRKNVKALLLNRPLICTFFSSVAISLRSMGFGAMIYFFKETMNNYALATFIGIGSSIPSYLFMLAVPFLAKRFSPRNLCIAGYAFAGFMYLLFFFSGYSSIFWVAFFFIVSGIPSGMISTCATIIVADSVDYMEWRTGVRSEGLVWSINGLKTKAASTLSGVWLPIGLGFVGYHVAQANSEFIIQSDATKQGLFYLVALAPLAGSVLAIVPLLFDNFFGKNRERIFAELEERRKKAIEEEKALEASIDPELAAEGVGAEGAVTETAENTTETIAEDVIDAPVAEQSVEALSADEQPADEQPTNEETNSDK